MRLLERQYDAGRSIDQLSRHPKTTEFLPRRELTQRPDAEVALVQTCVFGLCAWETLAVCYRLRRC